ncbi:MAG: helix-turn-helix domain-containing protein [Candidatus Levyibacteriota bacterium]
MANIYQKLGESVRKYRRKAGLSQEELAVKAKLDLTSVSEIESGLRNPSLKTLHKLASALRITVNDLIPF